MRASAYCRSGKPFNFDRNVRIVKGYEGAEREQGAVFQILLQARTDELRGEPQQMS